MTHASSRPSTDRAVDPRAHRLGDQVSAGHFKELFRGHPGGVAVITAHSEDGPVALTASSVSSVSVDPPLLIFSASAQSSATAAIVGADTIVVHLLDAADLDLALLGAASGADRFSDAASWTRLVTGEPVYQGVRAWLRCAIVSRMDAGGSTVVAAHALQSQVNRDVTPGGSDDALVYHNRAWHRLGEHSRLG